MTRTRETAFFSGTGSKPWPPHGWHRHEPADREGRRLEGLRAPRGPRGHTSSRTARTGTATAGPPRATGTAARDRRRTRVVGLMRSRSRAPRTAGRGDATAQLVVAQRGGRRIHAETGTRPAASGGGAVLLSEATPGGADARGCASRRHRRAGGWPTATATDAATAGGSASQDGHAERSSAHTSSSYAGPRHGTIDHGAPAQADRRSRPLRASGLQDGSSRRASTSDAGSRGAWPASGCSAETCASTAVLLMHPM